MIKRTNRSSVLFLAALLSAGGGQLFGQKSSGTAAGTGAGATATGTRGTPTTTTTNNPTLNPSNNSNTNNDPFSNRPIFLTGKVMFDDGSAVNKDVAIQKVCGASTRTETHVDSSGRFSFEIGGSTPSEVMSADIADFGSSPQSQSSSLGGSNSSNGGSGRNPETALWGCELRASYPGYRSDAVPLAGRRSMDDPNVGTIILHHLGNVQGTTISVTTAEAPKSAQKNFEKGMQAAQKSNVEEAEKRLLAATGEYPKYAVAWFMLGQVQQRQNKVEDARKSYLAAVAADKRYVSPYDQLALLAARETKWADAAQYSKQAIDLNPVEFPSSFWYNTVANYNLRKDAEASKSAQALLKLDTLHHYPEVNRLLAELALNKKDYSAAADYLKAYLAQVPGAKDAETLKQQLLKIEEASAQLKQ
jgi:Tfp pilus assembly protein PilF